MALERVPPGDDDQWTEFINAHPDAAEVWKDTAAPIPTVNDPMATLPLTPGWVKTWAGWKARTRVGVVNSGRRFRRWLRRQPNGRGHAAQIARGTRRTHDWVNGFNGIHVQAAAHQAHTATREARDAARRARYTIMPGQRQAARQAADRAQTQAMSAVQAHAQARRQVRRGRILRGAAAYGTPLLLDTAAAIEFGALGLAGGIFTTLSVAAWIGRKPLTAEAWDPERRALGDGDPLT
jgi:S-DNA-T family DNA segregation ATPase FtsK/SpoIIIE